MKIEILSTGNEVVSGDIVDSNSARISRRLMLLGLATQRHQAVGDDRIQLRHILTEISARADVCICSGGLGPTEDDLTAEVVSQVLGVDLVLDEEASRRMRARFAEFNAHFPENNLKSARLPRGARVLQNEVGTAPAFVSRMGSCEFWFLPGVPSEFDFFVETQIIPAVRERIVQTEAERVQVRQFKTLGWGESALSEKFHDFEALFPKIEIGYRAHLPEVWLKLTARGASLAEAQEQLVLPSQEVRHRLGTAIFGEQEQELGPLVHDLFIQRGLSLAVAESCTGGLLSSWLTAMPGSSRYFLGGAITYSNALKVQMLGVLPKTLEQFGAVSEPVAREMATGICQISQADWGISITGVAGPSGGSAEKPVGLVYCGMMNSRTGQVWVDEWRLRGERERVQSNAAALSLHLLRQRIEME